jgi:hypothetical protein
MGAMPTEIITAATIIAGSGTTTWFADKLFGPSIEGLGNHLKVYAGARLSKIFARTKELTKDRDIKPLPPGFTMVVSQLGSISEDCPEITEMWANLIASAASEQSSRHVIFADILSQIGRQEALILARLDRPQERDFSGQQHRAIRNLQNSLNQGGVVFGYGDEDTEAKLAALMMNIQESAHGEISAVEMLNKRDGEVIPVVRRAESAISYDILERQRLTRTTIVGPGSIELQSPRVHFATLTDLGVEFLRTCTAGPSEAAGFHS